MPDPLALNDKEDLGLDSVAPCLTSIFHDKKIPRAVRAMVVYATKANDRQDVSP